MSTERIIDAAVEMLESLAVTYHMAAKVCRDQQQRHHPHQTISTNGSRALILQGMATAHTEDARLIEAHILGLRHREPGPVTRLVAVPDLSTNEETEACEEATHDPVRSSCGGCSGWARTWPIGPARRARHLLIHDVE